MSQRYYYENRSDHYISTLVGDLKVRAYSKTTLIPYSRRCSVISPGQQPTYTHLSQNHFTKLLALLKNIPIDIEV